MNMNFKVQDRLHIKSVDSNGHVLDERTTFQPDNLDHRVQQILGNTDQFANDLILDAGLADVAALVMDRYDYISVGTGTTIPEHDDTGLESEVLDRAVATKAQTTTFFTDDTITLRGLFTPVSNVTIAESGIHLLASASGDICFARETFTPVLCEGGGTTEVAWQIIFMR